MTRILVVDDSPPDLALVEAHINNTRPRWEVKSAGSGSEALAQIAEVHPDVLITDLRMPQMDGIQLIAAMKRLRPELPVIITTARGSEELAVEALAKGAASYIPKNQMTSRLVETVEQVLARVHAEHKYRRLIGSLNRTEYEFAIESDFTLIPPLVDLLQQISFGVNLVDTTERRRLGVALDEALLNAVYHGNLELPADELGDVRCQLREDNLPSAVKHRAEQEPYIARRISVRAVITPQEGSFVIRDDGRGFDVRMIPDARNPKTLEEEGGRGLLLMKSFVDEVNFNETGNEVTLIKRRSATP
jgi:CheY-like chemotaxis protein